MKANGGRGVSGLMFLAGVVIGVAGLIAIRLVAQEGEPVVHFHANWAVIVNGERFDLTANRYMEDVGRCSVDPSYRRPEDRVHMHMGDHDVVHVHAAGVTWGHLLANIGFGVGETYLDLGPEQLESGEGRTLKFVLNGTPIRSIRNLAIDDADRLLISYGPESVAEVIADQFPRIAENAEHFNTMPDPASCSGQQEETWGGRLRRAVGV